LRTYTTLRLLITHGGSGFQGYMAAGASRGSGLNGLFFSEVAKPDEVLGRIRRNFNTINFANPGRGGDLEW
jgi:hypothetical protein